MASIQTYFDGHLRVRGVDGNTDPSELPEGFMSGAINRTFRGGTNATRPPIRSMKLEFSDAATENAFRLGAISGAYGYNRYFKGSNPTIVVACGGRILAGSVAGSLVKFKTIAEGIDPTLMHTWFAKADDRLYIQNGVMRPIGWDGINPSYIVEETTDSMPIGTAMTFCQGRLIVTTADNYVVVSDHIYGSTLANTSGVEIFSEFQQYNDIGVVSSPFDMGYIAAPIPIPQPGTVNSQGPLLIMCSNGAYALDLSRERSTWLTGGIQTIVLSGRGAASSSAIVALNNDVWYQSTDGGISSYRYERQSRDSSAGNMSMSAEVEKYLKYTDPSRLRFVSMNRVHNRVITTCAITIDKSGLGGTHRFGQGMVALDLFTGTTSNARTGHSWEGLWTGPNPIELVNLNVDGALRHFCLSHDDDGKNRIYEFMRDGSDDEFEDCPRKIFSSYTLHNLFRQTQIDQKPVNKKIISGSATVSGALGKVAISADYRPAYYPAWTELFSKKFIGTDEAVPIPADGSIPALDIGPQYDDVQGETVPMDVGEQASVRLTGVSNSFQVRVNVEGSASVNMFQVEAQLITDTKTPAVDADDDRSNDLIKQSPENIFSYKICPQTPAPQQQ